MKQEATVMLGECIATDHRLFTGARVRFLVPLLRFCYVKGIASLNLLCFITCANTSHSTEYFSRKIALVMTSYCNITLYQTAMTCWKSWPRTERPLRHLYLPWQKAAGKCYFSLNLKQFMLQSSEWLTCMQTIFCAQDFIGINAHTLACLHQTCLHHCLCFVLPCCLPFPVSHLLMVPPLLLSFFLWFLPIIYASQTPFSIFSHFPSRFCSLLRLVLPEKLLYDHLWFSFHNFFITELSLYWEECSCHLF